MANEMPVFSPGVGYGIIVGLGAFFAIGMSFLSWGLSAFMQEGQTSEMFATAKHSIKTGLTASAVVSSWTIAATLLSSSTEGYSYGVSGPFWYGAGATVQIFLFSVAAIELKRKAPNCHTFLEVVKLRYGPKAHLLLAFYSLFFQVFTSVNLLVGGSTLFSVVTGMNRDAACFLFPIGVLIYTLFGGIKATFLTDWAHTVVIYVVMLVSIFIIYVSSSQIGSPDRMYELLREAAQLHPVAGNAEGYYLTMKSPDGAYIGLIFIGAGFASAVDSQLFQKAIAADPASTFLGYMVGGLCWFTIPFVLATTYGLTAAAVEHLPSFPTYPHRMSQSEVTSGMAMPYAAVAVMGKPGAGAIMLMMFMAVTSAMSSETIATSTLITYDAYKAYFAPQATSAMLVRVSQIAVISFGIIVAAVAVAFNHAGFSVNYLINAIGIFVDSAIVPMAGTILWKKQSLAAVIVSPLSCSCAAIAAWLLTAYTHAGELSIASTSLPIPLVAGNMMSLCGPLVVMPVVTFLKPQNFDWDVLKGIQLDGASRSESGSQPGPELGPELVAKSNFKSQPNTQADVMESFNNHSNTDRRLHSARNRGIILSLTLCLCFLILWPIPMYATGYVFSKPFFRGWIVVVFLWAFFGAITITSMPIWESRGSIVRFFLFAFGRRRRDPEGTMVITAEDVSIVEGGDEGRVKMKS